MSLIQISYAVVASNNARVVTATKRPALTIVRDETPHGHGLHRVRDDADCSMVDPGRGAEQDSVLCVELRCARWLAGSAALACHGLPSRCLCLLQSNIIATELMRRGELSRCTRTGHGGGTSEYWPIKLRTLRGRVSKFGLECSVQLDQERIPFWKLYA